MTDIYLWYAIAASILALLYGAFLIYRIMHQSPGEGKMVEIAKAIQEGAKAYLTRQYKTVGLVALIIVILMYLTRVFSHNGFSTNTILAFIVGAVCSAIAGFIGMNVSVRANVRTAQAAKSGIKQALGLHRR